MGAPIDIADAPPIRVLFAPDWRAGVPYQELLAGALEPEGVEVSWMSDYRRFLPLSRGVARHAPEILHLHWPEAYYSATARLRSALRMLRFPIDLALALRKTPMVLTAHNLWGHNLGNNPVARFDSLRALRSATAVIAHSSGARDILIAHGIAPSRCHVIPQGDLSVPFGEIVPDPSARGKLGLPDTPVALMFGTVDPYKGIEEMLRLWPGLAGTVTLAIIGKPVSPSYGDKIARMASQIPNTRAVLRWIDDTELRLWLQAADCALFNYPDIFTSGAASLARCFGLPVLIPGRLSAIDLGEPDPTVFRFGPGTFSSQLAKAVAIPRDLGRAVSWRERIAWNHIAGKTAAVYRSALAGRPPARG